MASSQRRTARDTISRMAKGDTPAADAPADVLVAPDGWDWTPKDVTCSACGAVNPLPEQPPEWLERPEGVVWECSTCGARHRLGGHDVPAGNAVALIVECMGCGSTFPAGVLAEDGTFTCEACSTVNRVVEATDSVITTEVVSK